MGRKRGAVTRFRRWMDDRWDRRQADYEALGTARDNFNPGVDCHCGEHFESYNTKWRHGDREHGERT